jgi:hypothetical protein
VLLAKGFGATLYVFNVIQDQVLSTRIWLSVLILFVFVFLPWAFTFVLAALISQFRYRIHLVSTAFHSVVWAAGLLYVVISVFQLFPQLDGMWTIASKADDRQVLINRSGSDLQLEGYLGYGDYGRVNKHIKNSQNDDISRVVLNLEGGELHEMRKLSRLLTARKLTTHVEDECLQLCLLVFAGGYLRTASNDAHFSFDKYSGYENGYRIDWVVEREKDKDQKYFESRGISVFYSYKLFYGNANKQPFEHSVAEMRVHQVINR